MEEHLRQAAHNESFHACIVAHSPDQFYDWKITILFYTTLHWLHALAAMKGIDIGQTHSDVKLNCNPKRKGSMPITENAWRNYFALYNYSHSARYDGIMDTETYNELKMLDYSEALNPDYAIDSL